MDPRKTTEQLARQLDVVRQRKIKRIRARILRGQYHIKNSDVAKALFVAP